MRETTLSESQKNVKAIFVWILGCGVLLGGAGSAFAGEIRDHRADPNDGPRGYTFCARHGQRCQFRGTAEVAYGPLRDVAGWGPRGGYVLKTVSGGIDCNEIAFRGGSADTNLFSHCYMRLLKTPAKESRDHRGDPVGPFGYTFCAKPGERCQFRGTADVAFGVINGDFTYRFGVSNGWDCPNSPSNPGIPLSWYACFMKLKPIPSNVLDHGGPAPTGPATSGPQESGPKRGGRAPVDSVQPGR